MSSTIRYGVGGWTFAPWRGVFYPEGLPQKEELAYASKQLTSIEINGTFYGSQKPATFAKWRDETPEGFMFAVKAPRYATHRRKLSEAGPTVERFLNGGVLELKEKFGPINWQLMPTTPFDPVDLEGFLKLLPPHSGTQRLRHALEVRHASFQCAEFVALAEHYGVAVITAGDAKYPQIADPTADFVYLRIMGTSASHPTGYSPEQIARWRERARIYQTGRIPGDLNVVRPEPVDVKARDVYVYVISGHKELNPAAACALLERANPPSDGAPLKQRAPVRKALTEKLPRKKVSKKTPSAKKKPKQGVGG